MVCKDAVKATDLEGLRRHSVVPGLVWRSPLDVESPLFVHAGILGTGLYIE